MDNLLNQQVLTKIMAVENAQKIPHIQVIALLKFSRKYMVTDMITLWWTI